jgi:hypothetical protein
MVLIDRAPHQFRRIVLAKEEAAIGNRVLAKLEGPETGRLLSAIDVNGAGEVFPVGHRFAGSGQFTSQGGGIGGAKGKTVQAGWIGPEIAPFLLIPRWKPQKLEIVFAEDGKMVDGAERVIAARG